MFHYEENGLLCCGCWGLFCRCRSYRSAADHSALGTEVIPPFSYYYYYYYYYIYHIYAGYLQFFIITDYDVLFIVRNGSGGLHVFIPYVITLPSRLRFDLFWYMVMLFIIIIIIKVQGQCFAVFK